MGARLTIRIEGLHTHNLGALNRGMGRFAKTRARAGMGKRRLGERSLDLLKGSGAKGFGLGGVRRMLGRVQVGARLTHPCGRRGGRMQLARACRRA